MSNEPSIPTQGTSTFGDTHTGGIITIPWVNGLRAGWGYDSRAHVAKGTSPAETHCKFEEGTGIDRSGLEVKRVENSEDLRRVLDIKSQVSGSYGMFSGSVSGGFVEEVSMNAYSLYFVIKSYAFVKEDHANPLPIVITDMAAEMSAADFQQSYGDYYVSACQRGSIFYALIEVQSRSEETKEELRVSLSAALGSATTNSISTEFSSGLRKASSREGVSLGITLFCRGVGGEFLSKVEKVPEMKSNGSQAGGASR